MYDLLIQIAVFLAILAVWFVLLPRLGVST